MTLIGPKKLVSKFRLISDSGISSIGFSSVIYALGGLGYLILLPERLDRTAGTSEMGLSSNIATGAILVLCFDLIDLVDF